MIITCYYVTGHAWPEDKDHCEDKGRMINADPSKLGERTKKRVLAQVLRNLLVYDNYFNQYLF